ncbi:MAG TPA: hypothetical protein VK181_10165 [Rhizobium sp.]|nr:hypothetical protein [Rhizobium sp.]
MHYEYAVEPQAIGSSWENFRYLIEKFGFDRGRLISQFPKSWFRDVYEAANALTPMQRKMVEEALKQAKRNKVVRNRRAFDPAIGSWLDNALVQHRQQPFRAIIAGQARRGEASVLSIDTLDESAPLMRVPHESDIPRDVESIAAALLGLLQFGSRLVFVDPYFDPFNPRQRKLFRELLRLVSEINPGATCEFHYRNDTKKGLSNEVLRREAAALSNYLIPSGMKISFFCWCEREGGEDFHARYLLTERGGIRVDAGFEPVGSQETTDFTIMDSDLVHRRLAAVSPDAGVYKLVGHAICIASDGSVISLED